MSIVFLQFIVFFFYLHQTVNQPKAYHSLPAEASWETGGKKSIFTSLFAAESQHMVKLIMCNNFHYYHYA